MASGRFARSSSVVETRETGRRSAPGRGGAEVSLGPARPRPSAPVVPDRDPELEVVAQPRPANGPTGGPSALGPHLGRLLGSPRDPPWSMHARSGAYRPRPSEAWRATEADASWPDSMVLRALSTDGGVAGQRGPVPSWTETRRALARRWQVAEIVLDLTMDRLMIAGSVVLAPDGRTFRPRTAPMTPDR